MIRHLDSAAERYDAERKEVPDPHHVEEIAMLERSLACSGLTPAGLETTLARLAALRRIAPFYDGRRMIGGEPCRCERCEAVMERSAAA